jgi:hypothetical protein
MILVLTIFLIIYIPTSIFVINRHLDLRRSHLAQTEEMGRLRTEISENKKTLHKYEQRLALLNDYMDGLREGTEEELTPMQGRNILAQGSARQDESRTRYTDEEESSDLVDVRDMVIEKDGPAMSVKFKLVNIKPGDEAVNGYIHILAMGEGADPPPERTYPQVKVQDGFPINFRRGQIFLIQRFKPYSITFDLLPNSETPIAVKVLAYNRAGELILEKEFEVTDES